MLIKNAKAAINTAPRVAEIMAEELNKPLVIHCREAEEDCRTILAQVHYTSI